MTKVRGLITAIAAVNVLSLAVPAAAQSPPKSKIAKSTEPKLVHSKKQAAARPTWIAARRKSLIQRKKAFRDALEDLLVDYQRKLLNQSAEHELKKQLYDGRSVSQTDLERSARALANTRVEIKRVRQWIEEDDVALALAEEQAGEELERLSPLAPGGYQDAGNLIRFNGAGHWSLVQAGKIRSYFLERFGYALPISALGQSSTHDRMGFDHRDALDVALGPDSPEGRVLMSYLRSSGIPFIAFRGKIQGASTGAHIHIGKPSLRVAQPKPGRNHGLVADKSGDQS